MGDPREKEAYFLFFFTFKPRFSHFRAYINHIESPGYIHRIQLKQPDLMNFLLLVTILDVILNRL